MSDAQQLVNTMKKILLATVAIVAFSAPSFAAETAKTVGQAPPSFYLAQDTATLKCQIVETQPAAGTSMKVVGAAHSTKASAENNAIKAQSITGPLRYVTTQYELFLAGSPLFSM
jgi:selenophosphate synthase